MATVVVGYVAKPEGDAALAKAIEEAKLRGAKLVVVNSHRGGAEYDGEAALRTSREIGSVQARLDESGVEYDVRQMVRGFEPSEDLISLAGGQRRRPDRDRAAQADARRQADPGQQRPADPARRPLPRDGGQGLILGPARVAAAT